MPLTEEKWLEARVVRPMWPKLKTASNRKLRLLACACCHSVWHLLFDSRSQQAVNAAELYADGHISRHELLAQEMHARAARQEYTLTLPDGARLRPNAIGYALRAAECAAHFNKLWIRGATDGVDFAQQLERDGAEQSSLIGGRVPGDLARDIFGNPFRPVTLDPRWRTSTVLDLSRTIYDERVFERMPILADALMDAGCDSETLINHCRSDGPHVRGCWVVDLILSKDR
jgi:hypothetical protein